MAANIEFLIESPSYRSLCVDYMPNIIELHIVLPRGNHTCSKDMIFQRESEIVSNDRLCYGPNVVLEVAKPSRVSAPDLMELGSADGLRE
jgi:hypothetical protein